MNEVSIPLQKGMRDRGQQFPGVFGLPVGSWTEIT